MVVKVVQYQYHLCRCIVLLRSQIELGMEIVAEGTKWNFRYTLLCVQGW
jgi:hypothetical protein